MKKEKAQDVPVLLDYCVSKVRATLSGLTAIDSLPRNINHGQSKWNYVRPADWTSGFWPGILWYSYEVTGDTSLLKAARKYTGSLKSILARPVDGHDLGFRFYCSYGNGYRLTKDPTYYDVLIEAADSLATLFNPKVGTLLSWPSMRKKMNWPHNTIIDNMMNLELLFWAAKNGENPSYYDIAEKHAETTMKTLVRPDYTTFHVAVFDTTDGHFIKGVTHQGYADNSLWARGQAWGIYGFTMCYRETGKAEFLETAKNLALVFISKLPPNHIPWWDFDAPKGADSPRDASAAAIAASAMLELSTFVTDKALKEKFKTEAEKILMSLSSPQYLSGNVNQAFLLHSTGHLPNGYEIDSSIIYADYYYLEALMRLKKLEGN